MEEAAFVFFDYSTSAYTVHTYSLVTGTWGVFTCPLTGNVTVTKVGNTLVFWKVATNSICVFSGSGWFPLTTNNAFPNIGTVKATTAYNNNLVVLWDNAGVINGRMVDVAIGSIYFNPSHQMYFAPQWTNLNAINAPISTSSQTLKIINNNLIVWGGYNGAVYVNTGAVYNFLTNTWIAINSVGSPEGKQDVYIEDYKGRIIIFGGSNGNLIGQTDAVGGLYDINTQSWTLFNTANRPWTGYYPVIFLYKDYLYFKGAYSANGGPPSRYNVSSGRYNLKTNQWEQTSNIGNGVLYGINTWSGKYFASWLGTIGGLTGAGNSFLRDGFIESDESFGVDKAYHLYSRQ